jgi:hypothetical protein
LHASAADPFRANARNHQIQQRGVPPE